MLREEDRDMARAILSLQGKYTATCRMHIHATHKPTRCFVQRDALGTDLVPAEEHVIINDALTKYWASCLVNKTAGVTLDTPPPTPLLDTNKASRLLGRTGHASSATPEAGIKRGRIEDAGAASSGPYNSHHGGVPWPPAHPGYGWYPPPGMYPYAPSPYMFPPPHYAHGAYSSPYGPPPHLMPPPHYYGAASGAGGSTYHDMLRPPPSASGYPPNYLQPGGGPMPQYHSSTQRQANLAVARNDVPLMQRPSDADSARSPERNPNAPGLGPLARADKRQSPTGAAILRRGGSASTSLMHVSPTRNTSVVVTLSSEAERASPRGTGTDRTSALFTTVHFGNTDDDNQSGSDTVAGSSPLRPRSGSAGSPSIHQL